MKMEDDQNYGIFAERLIKQSEDKTYRNARNEWVPIKYWEVEGPIDIKCLCGAPIKKVMLVKNIFNGHEEFVGINCLQELVIHVNGKTAKRDYYNLCRHTSVVPNPALVIYAYLENHIEHKEYNFLIDMSRGEWGKLTPHQQYWLIKLNKKMIGAIKRPHLERVFWPKYGVY